MTVMPKIIMTDASENVIKFSHQHLLFGATGCFHKINPRREFPGDESRKHNDVDERYPPRKDFHHRGGRGGFVRPNRGGWGGEGNVQRPQWDDNRWQGGPNRPPFMRGGPRGHFPRGGGMQAQGDFGAPRFWGPQGPRPGQFNSSFPPPMHPANRPSVKGADLPMADVREMELARLNFSRTLNIDGVARDIRHYGEHTIILMRLDKIFGSATI